MPEPITTLTAWKRRLQKGVQIRLCWTLHGGEKNRTMTITGVQTHAIFGTVPGIENRAWIWFPKRDDISFTEKGWFILEDSKKIAEYEWVISE